MKEDFNNTTPYTCPYCHGEGLRDEGTYEGDYIEFIMECTECGKKWLESFDLSKECIKEEYIE